MRVGIERPAIAPAFFIGDQEMASEKSYYVYSTLAANMKYTVYEKTANDFHKEIASVLIKGGAGVADTNFVTPLGVVTTITQEQYEILKKVSLFNDHVKAGHLTVQERQVDVEKIVADMNRLDPSAPKTPNSPEFQNKDPITA